VLSCGEITREFRTDFKGFVTCFACTSKDNGAGSDVERRASEGNESNVSLLSLDLVFLDETADPVLLGGAILAFSRTYIWRSWSKVTECHTRWPISTEIEKRFLAVSVRIDQWFRSFVLQVIVHKRSQVRNLLRTCVFTIVAHYH
jgi:hypothetical protein